MDEIRSVVLPPTASHTHTIVFLHGRGDNVQNFVASLDYSRDSHQHTLRERFPSFKWVFPEAPIRPSLAFPDDKRRQWFDIWNVSDFSDREELQAEGLAESVVGIRRILSNEATALGGHWDRIILAGISQGAATSVHTLLNLNIPGHPDSPTPRRLAAFVGFSCRMPFPGRTLVETRKILNLQDVPADNEVLRNTPLLLEHCVDDPLVLVRNGRALRDSLRGFGMQVDMIEYPNGGHWFNSPGGMDDAVKFLNRHLSGQMDTGGNHSGQGRDPDAMDLS
ncbi:putative phospholipase carboxylesterase family protein [Eutypa lata UCREL1]|uniref:Putative phospholipase carboxylesterase family protein n=1 Tax=Eutypa lata (strain UCR-EL1) TaxID=1287681 RepID=M7SY01_EUTLA|nr:putative phospholipase carboxylesterase family protein [Eutypa lata UCREL1]